MAIRTPRLHKSRDGVFRFRYLCPQKKGVVQPRKEICVSLRTRNSVQARIIALFLNHVIESKLTNKIDRDLLQNLAAYASPFTLKVGRLTVEVKDDAERSVLERTLKDKDSELAKLMRQAATEEPSDFLRAFDAGINGQPLEMTLQRTMLNVRKPLPEAIEQFLKTLPAIGNFESTIKGKATKLCDFHQWLVQTKKLTHPGYPHEVHASDISDWIAHYNQMGAKGRRVGAKTVAGLYTVLNDFFEHCVGAQLCSNNPVAGFATTKTKVIRQAKQERRSYRAIRIDDIQRIFHPDLYFSCMAQADVFFGPLIAIFTGARREEIAALKESDFSEEQITEDKKIWSFTIRAHMEDGRRLKNQNSERVVPVCDALIEVGLIDYLQRIREFKKPNESALDLFPARKAAKKGNKLGEKFSWYLKTVGVKVDQGSECFHSLRHTVITNLIALEVPPQVSMTIVGHLAQTDLEKYGYQRGNAQFSGSVHHSDYDASNELGYSTSHPRERSKKALDKLNEQFKIDTVALGKHAKEVILLTRRLAKGEFESGRRAPDFDTLCKQFPDLELTHVKRVRYQRKPPTSDS